jgi:hypothetical protein
MTSDQRQSRIEPWTPLWSGLARAVEAAAALTAKLRKIVSSRRRPRKDRGGRRA